MYDEIIREKFKELISESGLEKEDIKIISNSTSNEFEKNFEFRILSPEWFNLPDTEYAIVRGEEVVMECVFRDAKAQVFTPSPFSGVMKLSEVINLNLNKISNRSVFYASLNAMMRHLGLIDKTVHCRGYGPLECASLLTHKILCEHGNVPLLLIGYQPAMVKALSKNISRLYVTDLSTKTVGKKIANLEILDGAKNPELVEEVEVVIATGSTLVNSTLWQIYDKCLDCGVKLILYGVTAAGVAKILGIERFCPLSL